MKGFDDIIITEVDGEKEMKKPEKGSKKPEKGGKIERKTNHVAFVMDHSGSMTGQRKVALENFNEQLESLKRNSKDYDIDTRVSVIEFDERVLVKHRDVSINDIKPAKDYWTGGLTSLNDAIFKGIKLVEKGLKNDMIDDKSALIIIMTDGYENSSKEFQGDKGRDLIKKEIKKLEKSGLWTFTFMGADMNVQDIAVDGYGMSVGNTMSFTGDKHGYKMSGNSAKRGIDTYYSSRVAGASNIVDFHNDNTGSVDLNTIDNSTTDAVNKEEEK